MRSLITFAEQNLNAKNLNTIKGKTQLVKSSVRRERRERAD